MLYIKHANRRQRIKLCGEPFKFVLHNERVQRQIEDTWPRRIIGMIDVILQVPFVIEY